MCGKCWISELKWDVKAFFFFVFTKSCCTNQTVSHFKLTLLVACFDEDNLISLKRKYGKYYQQLTLDGKLLFCQRDKVLGTSCYFHCSSFVKKSQRFLLCYDLPNAFKTLKLFRKWRPNVFLSHYRIKK